MAGAGLTGTLRERALVAGRGIAVLVLLIGLYGFTRALGWRDDAPNALFALGLLLVGGSVAGTVASFFRLPRLTGYLAAGIIAGPHVTHALDHAAVQALSVVNALALALIALEAGAELTMPMLKRCWRSLLWQCATHTAILAVGMALVFLALGTLGLLDFTAGLTMTGLVAVAVLWGVIAVSKSPAATLAILKETHAKGPVTDVSLGVVVLFDIVVLVLFAAALMVAEVAVTPTGALSLAALETLGVELVASVAAGTTFGLVIAMYFSVVGKERLLFLLVVAYGITAFCTYFHYDTLLVFATAGFVVTNLTRQGPALVDATERMGAAVMVVFFATAGAHLDLGVLAAAWPIALTLAVTRGGLTWAASQAGHALAHDPPPVRRYTFTSLISQAGVTIGLATIAAQTLGALGHALATLAIAVVAVNEIVGPVIFKLGLARAGEVNASAATDADETKPPARGPPRSRRKPHTRAAA